MIGPVGCPPGGSAREPVLVVGAGPAGSSLALRLSRQGLAVRILDASSFPRSKPCGDCLSPGATPLLRELGVLEAIRRRRPARLRGWRIRTPEGRWFGGRFSPRCGRGPPHGLALSRSRLDEALLEAAVEAGAEFRPRERVFRLLRSGERVVGAVARGRDGREIHHRASLVVGADGLRSAVARRTGGVDRGPRRRLALVARCRVGPHPGALGELRLLRDGVVGIAPAGERLLNVTAVVPASQAEAISGDRRAFFRDRLSRAGADDRLSAATPEGSLEITGPFEVEPREIAGPGFLLVGDATGYFDPLTGQGIFRALATARAAARVIPGLLAGRIARGKERATGGSFPSSPTGVARRAALRGRYRRAVRRLLGPGRTVQRAVDGVVSRRGLVVEAVGSLLRVRPGLAGLLLEVTGDRVDPSALTRPDRLARACLVRSQRTPEPGGPPAGDRVEAGRSP